MPEYSLPGAIGKRAAVVAGRAVRKKKLSLGALTAREREEIAASKVRKLKPKRKKKPDTRSGFQRLSDSLERKL